MPLFASTPWSLPIDDPVLVFAVVLLVILIAPMVVQRLRVPGVIGLIVAGAIIGPNALNVLERGESIRLLGTIGLLYIFMIAGLEIDLHRFRRYRSHSLVFGAATFLVPQVVGTVVALLLLGFDVAASILLASMFASHTLLSYPIASRLGIVRAQAVTTAVGGTIITDTAALLVLALVARSVRGELDAGFWLGLLGSITVYTVAMWLALPRIGRWYFRTVPALGTSHFVFLLTAVYLCAYLASVAGMEPIIGAFLGGLALNRLVPEQSALMGRVEFAGNWFFIPVFMISVGMLVNPRVLLTDPETWKVSLAMVVTVVVTKYLAAWLTGRILGYSVVETRVIFGLSVNQAAATLAAVVVGVDIGIFGEAVLNGAIMMILVTCVLGPWVTQRYGRELALAESRRPEDRAFAPRRILIPLRNPEAAEAIMDVALMVHEADSHEPLYPLTVVQDDDDASTQVAVAERMLGSAVMHAAHANVPVVPVTRLDNNAASGVIRAIREIRVSTVVMGWTGAGAAQSRIFGSVLDQLLEQCPQQFVVCRITAPLSTAKRIVLAVPRFADREIGFIAAMSTIHTLASRAGLGLLVCAAEADLEPIRRSLRRKHGSIPTEYRPVPSISDWLDPLKMELREDDLFVLLSARQHRISWQPSIDRLPVQIAKRTARTSMIVVYPPEEASTETAAAADTNIGAIDLYMLLRPERIALGLQIDSPRAIIECLLEPWCGDHKTTQALIVTELMRVIEEAPIEIASGVVLIHSRSPHVQQSMAFLATTSSGVVFGRVARPARIVIVLLSPLILEPSVRLQQLARIARLLSDPKTAEQILAARSPDDLRDLLMGVG